ncbi:MAG TPA: DNA polymerase III subunit gamma/tau [Pirellulales bacterium]|nr:DNA polymerase III subunit gamma/tau [Pirellulales bacterium]
MADTTELTTDRAGEYVVVARRYRPQTFADLVGQQHVAKALAGAIATNRVGHAYLFTGARGVGKTSSARILAKALDCVHGPTATPCNECDICRSISSGDDVDVLEIDGASNRGIDEMRQLRQNVNVRPSRARFKIYIIDEVHMLTKEAFNALLKTLEEPPEHVKFIFCTTEAEKIPITILSRCQRFDFAGIQTKSIAERLRQIVEAEGVEAETAALDAIARRAAGSMRDSQSLLEQLLAFGGQKLTLDDVNRMLGTAGDRRLVELAGRLVARDAAGALADLDRILLEGADIGPLFDQLLGYFRDVMVTAAGGNGELMLYSSPSDLAAVQTVGRELGIETVLAVMQILDQTLGRLRYSSHGRILGELALVRICRLEDLESLSRLVSQLREGTVDSSPREPSRIAAPARPPSPGPAPIVERPADETTSLARGVSAQPAPLAGTPPAGAQSGPESLAEAAKKKPLAAELSDPPRRPAESGPSAPRLTSANVLDIWRQVVPELGDMLSEMARLAADVAIPAPNRLVASFPEKYTSCKTYCERPENLSKLEQALARAAGERVRVEFSLVPDRPEADVDAKPSRPPMSSQQRLAEKAEHPLVRRAAELFGAFPVRVEEPPVRKE